MNCNSILYFFQMLALIHNMISGKLKSAEVYTNGWPEFSAVVCRSDDVLFHQVCIDCGMYCGVESM